MKKHFVLIITIIVSLLISTSPAFASKIFIKSNNSEKNLVDLKNYITGSGHTVVGNQSSADYIINIYFKKQSVGNSYNSSYYSTSTAKRIIYRFIGIWDGAYKVARYIPDISISNSENMRFDKVFGSLEIIVNDTDKTYINGIDGEAIIAYGNDRSSKNFEGIVFQSNENLGSQNPEDIAQKSLFEEFVTIVSSIPTTPQTQTSSNQNATYNNPGTPTATSNPNEIPFSQLSSNKNLTPQQSVILEPNTNYILRVFTSQSSSYEVLKVEGSSIIYANGSTVTIDPNNPTKLDLKNLGSQGQKIKFALSDSKKRFIFEVQY